MLRSKWFDTRQRSRWRKLTTAGAMLCVLLGAAAADLAIQGGTIHLGALTVTGERRYHPILAEGRPVFVDSQYMDSPAAMAGIRIGAEVYLLCCFREDSMRAWESGLDREIAMQGRQTVCRHEAGERIASLD